ncbi:MAG: endolytic transglycosylase MltG [Armatimonadota bacterium]|nr:endolytic transglycosylase MltG [Armatimonadota bacterium]MDR7550369.1 endolytic transglycosylase MltG [Armatimonadota bacterium]
MNAVEARSTPWHRRAARLLAAAVAGAVGLGGLGLAVAWWQVRPISPQAVPPRTVIIPPGASARQIGDRLAGVGLVRSAKTAAVVARALRVADRLHYGEYALSPSQSTVEIVRTIARGETVQHRITIPEGFTVRQIAEVLAAAGIVDRDQFLALALAGGRSLPHPVLAGLPTDSLEGYLFPDTYLFTRGLPVEAVVRRFLDRLEAGVGPQTRAAAAARGLSLHQLLTVASMIEREARVPDEQPVIAGVIYNRLQRGMRLEVDATVLYALGAHRETVTLQDLRVDSPYNTYRHPGLPPGPIANPGASAIEAAARPAAVPYLYYVLRPDGRHHFTRTLREHQDAVRQYRP